MTIPPLNALSIASLMALGGTVAMVWSKVKQAADMLVSAVIAKAAFIQESSKPMTYYALNHRLGSFIPGVRIIYGFNTWLSSRAGTTIVMAELMPLVPFLVMFKGRPVIMCRQGDSSDATGGNVTAGLPHTRHNDSVVRCYWIRGTVDIDEFSQHCLECYRAAQVDKKDGRTRFRITKLSGTSGEPMSMGKNFKGGQPSSSARIHEDEEDDEVKQRLAERLDRPIGFEVSDMFPNLENPFETFMYPPKVMDEVGRIKAWLDNKEWYNERSLPWQRGVLLKGRPGSGKSSLIRTLGMALDLPIFIFDLATMSNKEFLDEWTDMKTAAPCIAAVEDIDTVFKGRENVSNGSLTFDCLLNALNGIENCDGVLFMVTTNHPEHIDPALAQVDGDMTSRPGRVDQILEIEDSTEEQRRGLAQRMFKGLPQDVEEMVRAGEGLVMAQYKELCLRKAMILLRSNQTATNDERG